jgi:hypothetical protein
LAVNRGHFPNKPYFANRGWQRLPSNFIFMANFFLQTIEHLRHYEEVVLYGNLLHVESAHENEVAAHLEKEYRRESLHYPFEAPPFDPAAALWAAKTVYTASQLMLHRQNKPADLDAFFPAYPGTPTPGAVLSADLTLRFTPDILVNLKLMDPEDRLSDLLESHLNTWHYSAIGYKWESGELDFSVITSNPCLFQLYADRVVERKDIRLARHPSLINTVSASLGLHAKTWWSDFHLHLTAENGKH